MVNSFFYYLYHKVVHFILVDIFFASSKLCSCCGWKNNTLTLQERVWACLNCGASHDRDENVFFNLREEDIRILQKERDITIIHYISTVGTAGSNTFEDNVSPKEILQNLFR
ncbi:MAG: transposase [Candidatus Lokiarchaeota archaeon]|nr:transposase [Candidatus Lokiarchaeota archaeon]